MTNGKPPATNVIAGWVIEEAPEVFERLENTCVRALKLKLTGWSDDEIAELAESEVNNHLPECLRNISANKRDDGGTCNFEIDDENPPHICKTNTNLSTLQNKLRRLDPQLFEELCSEILHKLGGISKVSGKSGDGGVDFYATGIKTHSKDLPLPNNAALCVIGQAKRHKNHYVNETDLRLFVGGALLQLEELKRSKSLGLLGPTIFAFWTSSDFQENAKKFAKSMGIWYMDGITFAQYIKVLGLEHRINIVNTNAEVNT